MNILKNGFVLNAVLFIKKELLFEATPFTMITALVA
jgi:hypothetical protein